MTIAAAFPGAPKRRHSEKLEELQDMIERIWPEQTAIDRVELFARRQRSAWTCWGDQLPAEILGDWITDVFRPLPPDEAAALREVL